jgi:hypothetical protein
MANNQAMFASELIDESTLDARDDDAADPPAGIRSGAGCPASISERMSWFPSRISSMVARVVALHRYVDPVVVTLVAGSSLWWRGHDWPKSALPQVPVGWGEWSSPLPPVHPGDCRR